MKSFDFFLRYDCHGGFLPALLSLVSGLEAAEGEDPLYVETRLETMHRAGFLAQTIWGTRKGQ